MEQRLASSRTRQRVQVAYASVGHGPCLLFVGGWRSHLELSWALPAERRMLATGIERTDVVAGSLGVPLMIEWAARHPETADPLVLYGAWARGADIATSEVQELVLGSGGSQLGLGASVCVPASVPAPKSRPGANDHARLS